MINDTMNISKKFTMDVSYNRKFKTPGDFIFVMYIDTYMSNVTVQLDLNLTLASAVHACVL